MEEDEEEEPKCVQCKEYISEDDGRFCSEECYKEYAFDMFND